MQMHANTLIYTYFISFRRIFLCVFLMCIYTDTILARFQACTPYTSVDPFQDPLLVPAASAGRRWEVAREDGGK